MKGVVGAAMVSLQLRRDTGDIRVLAGQVPSRRSRSGEDRGGAAGRWDLGGEMS